MALDATQILGSPQLAGVKVNPRGMGKATGAMYGGMYGGVVGAAAGAARSMKANQEKIDYRESSDTPQIGRLAYFVVTPDEVALIELKSKIVTTYLDQVIARVPRAEVESVTLSGGGLYSPPLTVTFRNGEIWELEVPKPSKKYAKQVVEELGGSE
jgi:hypothetical protein